MKLLYVDALSVSVFPTATLAPALALRLTEDVTFFGPGLVEDEEVAGGLSRFVDRTGPYDCVLFGPNTTVLLNGESAVAASVDYIERFTSLRPRRPALAAGLIDIVRQAATLPIPVKLLWLLNFDYYATTPDQVARLDDGGFVMVGPNDQFIAKRDELPDYAKQEKHYRRKVDRLGDSFHDWVSRNPSRVIPLVHFVAESEFCTRALDSRRCDTAVPGAGYVLRDAAERKLRGSSRSVASKAIYDLFRLAGALRLDPLARFLGQRIYQASFQETLFDTRFVYTARGGFGIPVRKFFEIPAAGALMACVPPNGFESLGFVDGVTHVECQPEDFVAAVNDLCARPRDAQRIATCGLRKIAARHSLAARAEQLGRAASALVSGSYRGARWRAGDFVLTE